MSDTTLTTPRAILFGLLGAGALAGLGAFWGLRARDTARPGVLSPTVTNTVEVTPSSAPPNPTGTPDTQAAKARATEAARSALEQQRALLMTKCGAALGASRASFTLNFTFDAQGKQLTRGVVADRDAGAGVTTCVSNELPAIEIPGPGATVYLEVPFRLP